jgi:hypothetical protein
MKRLLKTLNEASTNATLDPNDRVLDAERAISNYLAQYRGKLRTQRRKLQELDNLLTSFTGDFWSDVRMFIALRIKQFDGDHAPPPRALMKRKK